MVISNIKLWYNIYDRVNWQGKLYYANLMTWPYMYTYLYNIQLLYIYVLIGFIIPTIPW